MPGVRSRLFGFGHVAHATVSSRSSSQRLRWRAVWPALRRRHRPDRNPRRGPSSSARRFSPRWLLQTARFVVPDLGYKGAEIGRGLAVRPLGDHGPFANGVAPAQITRGAGEVPVARSPSRRHADDDRSVVRARSLPDRPRVIRPSEPVRAERDGELLVELHALLAALEEGEIEDPPPSAVSMAVASILPSWTKATSMGRPPVGRSAMGVRVAGSTRWTRSPSRRRGPGVRAGATGPCGGCRRREGAGRRSGG